MFKRTLSCLVITFLIASALKSREIDKSNLFIPEKLGQIRVFHDKNGFVILKDGEYFEVQNCFVDKEVRNISDKQLGYFLGTIQDIEINGQKITLTKISNREIENKIEKIKDPIILKLNPKTSSDFIKQLSPGAYLVVGQMDNGEYFIHAKMRLPGAGIWGAIGGAWAGKFIASAVCHTGIWVVAGAVSIVATPAVGAIVGMSLESTLGTTIETFTTAAAVAGGIAGAVATGPV